MQIELAANESIKLNDMTISVKDGKLAVVIDVHTSVAQTLNNLVGAVKNALLPLMNQGIPLPEVTMPTGQIADPVAHVSALVVFAAVEGLRQQKAAQDAAAAQAMPAANDAAAVNNPAQASEAAVDAVH